MWYSKRQGSAKSLTYGAEFVALKTAIEHFLGLRYMLRLLGIHVDEPAFVFADNMGVVSNASEPSSALKKKHLGICYHLC